MKKSILIRTLSALMALFLIAELLPAPAFASDVDLPEEDAPITVLPEEDVSVEAEPSLPGDTAGQEDAEEPSAQPSAEDAQPTDEEAPTEETPADDSTAPSIEEPSAEDNADEDVPSEEAPSAVEEPDEAEPAEKAPASEESPAEGQPSEETPFPADDAEALEDENTPEDEASSEKPEEDAALSEEELEALRQQAIMDEFDQLLIREIGRRRTPSTLSFEDQLAQFPASYQPALKALHATHPNWSFIAVNTGLDWNAAVNAEYGTRSTLEYNYGPNSVASHLLLNNHDTYYSATSYSGTNHYRPIDGRFVSASRAAVAYYMDPRNFLTEKYIFQFEDQNFNSSIEESGVATILLSGSNTSTGLAKITTYVTTAGETKSLSELSSEYGETYPAVIYNVGMVTDVSPYFLASKIVQETGADTKSSVISGTVSGYVGYYNFYNIGSTSDPSGKAYINGLKYAKNHDWFNPIVALYGGAEFLADKYISKGQNTAYYMRFNVSPDRYYTTYGHQYMSALPASASEGSKTATGYRTIGAMNSAFLFYIPVYNNMPEQTSTVSLTPTTKGKTTKQVTLFKEASTTSSYLATVPSGTTVTVLGGTITSSDGYQNRLYYPYWYQVQVTVSGKTYTGYLYEQAVTLNSVYTLKQGSSKSIKSVLSATGNAGTIYYETSDPAVATVSNSGIVTAVANGTCTIYAISGGGSFDAIGLTVSNSGAVSAALDEPALAAIDNTASGVKISWQAVSGATGYTLYRKTSGSDTWSILQQFSSGATTSYTDTTAVSGTTYTYTLRAISSGLRSDYDATGLTIRYLKTPALLSATSVSNGISVKWEKVTGATGYRIYRKNTGTTWTQIGSVSSGSTTSYTDNSNMASGTTYVYTVRAYDGAYSSYFDAKGVSAVSTYTPLAVPALGSASNTDSGVTVKWSAVSGATGYTLYRKTGGSSKWDIIKQISSGSATSYTDPTAVSGTKYTYTLRATNAVSRSGYNATGVSTVYLKTPTLSSATAASGGITVKWAKVTGAAGYTLYRRAGSSTKWDVIAQISSGATVSYTDDSGLISGTTYTYTLRAVSSGGYRSYFSTTGISAKAISGQTAASLSVPVLKSISNVSNGVTVTWGAVSGATSYQVYRKTSHTNWSMLGEVTTPSYTDKTVSSGTSYTYTVRARSSSTRSGYDPSGIATHYLKTPSLISATAASSGITVKWEQVTGAKGYHIYRKTAGSGWAKVGQVTSGATTSYTDSSKLASDTTYIYTVRAYSGGYRSYYATGGISAKVSSDPYVDYVTTGMLNYRTGPGTTYSLGGTLAADTTVKVVPGSDVDVNGTIWYKAYINGSYYYLSSKYLKKA